MHEGEQEQLNGTRKLKCELYANVSAHEKERGEINSAISSSMHYIQIRMLTSLKWRKVLARPSTEERHVTVDKQFLIEVTLKLPVETTKERPHYAYTTTPSSGTTPVLS